MSCSWAQDTASPSHMRVVVPKSTVPGRCYRYKIQFSQRNKVKRQNRVWNIDFSAHKVRISNGSLPSFQLRVDVVYGPAQPLYLLRAIGSSRIFLNLHLNVFIGIYWVSQN